MAGYAIAKRSRRSTSWPSTRASARCAFTADALGAEQVAFSWRLMPPDTGGRGSYGHRHPGQEEIYFVIWGTLHVQGRRRRLRGGPQTAVRMTGEEFYSVHNDSVPTRSS